MLALKSILAQSDRISVLVFDEIDANIGGRMGSVVGTKLRDLAAHHQVLCITHLPQIAAFAHHHLRISKAIVEDQTHTRVEVLDDSRRVDELAEMLTGKNATATTRKQADEMITLAKNARDSQSAFEVEIPRRRRRAKSES
jgi:DNA repair protein RecN (Recombination protein N)